MNTTYNFNDWVKYAIHDDTIIKGFFGPYRWLSNFHKCPVWFEGFLYPSSENAFQAAKCELESDRQEFVLCTPAQSKKLWKEKKPLYTAEQWNKIKYDVMSVILFNKFYINNDLGSKLIATGNRYLEETNNWKDVDWGVDINLGGTNNLGKILTGIRTYWQNLTPGHVKFKEN